MKKIPFAPLTTHASSMPAHLTYSTAPRYRLPPTLAWLLWQLPYWPPCVTFNSPLPLHHNTARTILSKQDRTFYNSTQNPKMLHPFHSEEKPKSLQHVPGAMQYNSCPQRTHFLLLCPLLTLLPHSREAPSSGPLHRLFIPPEHTSLKQLPSCLHQ